MPNRRLVTGVFRTPDGTIFANKSLTWLRNPRATVSQGGAVIVDEPFIVQTNGAGEMSQEMEPGAYLVMARLKDADRYFEFNLPEGSGSFDAADGVGLLPSAGLPVVQQLVQQAIAAANAAGGFAEDAEGFAEDAAARAGQAEFWAGIAQGATLDPSAGITNAYQHFVGDGTSDPLTLLQPPVSINNVRVYFDGQRQFSFTLSGNQITPVGMVWTLGAAIDIEYSVPSEVVSVDFDQPFASRSAFINADIDSDKLVASFIVEGRSYRVIRDAAGPIEQANGQRWRPDGVTTPQHYGATGLGDEATDTAAVVAAFANSNHIFFPEGRYIFKAKPRSNSIVEGAGPASILQHPDVDAPAPHFSKGVLYLDNVENVIVRGFSCDGNKANITDPENNTFEMIDLDNCRNCHVYDIWGYDTWRELVDLDDSEDCSVTRVHGFNTGGPVVHISSNCKRVVAYDCTATACGTERAGGYEAFDFWTGTEACGFVNCRAIDCVRGFRFQGEKNFITDCAVVRSQNTALRVSTSGGIGGGHTATNVTMIDCNQSGEADSIVLAFGNRNRFINCTVQGAPTDGFRADSGTGPSANIFRGCVAEDVVGQGFRTSSAVANTRFENCVARNCGTGFRDFGARSVFSNCHSEGAANSDYDFRGPDAKVEACVSVNAGSHAFDTEAARTSFHSCEAVNPVNAGFFTRGSSSDTVAFDCRVDGAGGRSIDHFGAGLLISNFRAANSGNLRDNTNTVTATGRGVGSASGVVTANGGTGSITIAHGFPGVANPRQVRLTPMSADAAAQSFWVSAIGSTNITVTFGATTPAGTDNIIFAWEASL